MSTLTGRVHGVKGRRAISGLNIVICRRIEIPWTYIGYGRRSSLFSRHSALAYLIMNMTILMFFIPCSLLAAARRWAFGEIWRFGVGLLAPWIVNHFVAGVSEAPHSILTSSLSTSDT